MNILWVAVAAFVGGIISAVLGWLNSGEVFNARKFTASVITALVAGIVFAIGYGYSNGLSAMDVAIAFVGGAGVDAMRDRAAGYIANR